MIFGTVNQARRFFKVEGNEDAVKTHAETGIVQLPDIGNNREMGELGPYEFHRYARRGGCAESEACEVALNSLISLNAGATPVQDLWRGNRIDTYCGM